MHRRGVTPGRGVKTRMSFPIDVNVRCHGSPPYRLAVVHGGPGAAGDMAPLADHLAVGRGVLEPLQTADSVDGQIRELLETLVTTGTPPLTLIGFSWGAWLSLMVAAEAPAVVMKLILVGSGPFDERYAGGILATRLEHLAPVDRKVVLDGLAILSGQAAGNAATAFARVGRLLSQADAFDPEPDDLSTVCFDVDIFRRVWPEAAEWRRSGRLLALAGCISCPVVALHGEADPHPIAGVEEPLGELVADFRCVRLRRCGHKPWVERQARDEFFAELERALKE